MAEEKEDALNSGSSTKNKRTAVKRLCATGLFALLAFAAYRFAPESMPELARRTLGLFVFSSLLWATETLPLYATSLILIGFEILFLAEKGGAAGQGGLSYQEFLRPFASSVIVLFLGGFLLSRALIKHGLAIFLAGHLLSPFTRSPRTFLFALLGITAFLSMWMSNTACATMIFAILTPYLAKSQGSRFQKAAVLAVPFGAAIGGIATPIGSPPNAICLAILRQAGYNISFDAWMLSAVPLALLLLVISGFLLYALFKPENHESLHFPVFKPKQLHFKAFLTAVVFGITVLMWVTTPWHGLDESVPAIGAAALLTALGILDKKDLNSIDWDILILMWGGLSLSHAMTASGLSGWVGGLPFEQLSGGLRIAVFVVLSVFLSTFMSNTATAGMIIPLAMAASPENPVIAAFLAALATSMDLALPISTPPNTLAFATGKLKTPEMIRAGGTFSLIAALILLAGYRIILPLTLR